MKTMKRDGVGLAYDEVGSGSPPILFVHGWCGDHTVFAPQVEFFRRTHRVVSVDLRGHGASDAPRQDYTMAGFAADLSWQCAQLGLERPIVVGHSMGGNVALELAARYPELPAAIVLIDSALFPPPPLIAALREATPALRGQDYRETMHRLVSPLFLATDDPARKSQLLESMSKTLQHVLVSSFVNHITDYDCTAAMLGCRVPVAYIGAAISLVDLARFREACPQLVTGQTLGSGHFSPLEVPDQVNSMLARFLAVGVNVVS
jgi:pimeloyl-ACP methyl ester carboxylesterase